ncbi:uncharacterized protein MKZ38_009229 [Zalerion maritima]|uniref:Uncharacterized protein n=1 Tax=Zalerion maritima TaxID=339359 RepID=A0AAD5WT24_9PEZI|nr:uncharacterized protein MKZ38_009229 [Zalerion maritima]
MYPAGPGDRFCRKEGMANPPAVLLFPCSTLAHDDYPIPPKIPDPEPPVSVGWTPPSPWLGMVTKSRDTWSSSSNPQFLLTIATPAGKCSGEVHRRKHSLPNSSLSSVSPGLSFGADGRTSLKRHYSEVFPRDERTYVPPSPYERNSYDPRRSNTIATPGDVRYTQADPPVPMHSPEAAPPVSYSPSSLPYASPLSTGFGPAPDFAGYNIHTQLNPFPGQLSPIPTQSYGPSSSLTHQPTVAAASPHGTAGVAFLPSASSYNNTSPTSPSHTAQSHPQHHPSTSISAAATGNHPYGRGNMTRLDIPPGPLIPSPPNPYPGGGSGPVDDNSGFHNAQTRTSSTTIMHHEERTGFHVPQYYNPYGTDSQLDMQQQVGHDAGPTSAVDALGVDREWDMVPDAPRHEVMLPPATQDQAQPDLMDEDILMDGCSSAEQAARQAKTRQKFDEQKLVETNMTRRLKACCQRDPDDRDGTCKTCKTVSPNSKKVIHKIPCLRYKLTETVLYREGGLQLTKRWESNSLQIHNVGDWVTSASEIRTIELTLGICDEPIRLKVRKFAPKDGDVVHRHWVDGALKKKKELQPYALADVGATAKYYHDYVGKNCVDSFLKLAANKDPLIQKTYQMAVRHYRNLVLMENSELGRMDDPEIKFLHDLFRLVFAMRHTVGSSWICGIDKLDMEPEAKDTTYPLYNKVSTPRMILAQFDSINALKVLQPLRSKLLARLEEWVSSNRPTYWFTIYLSYFILLHEVSLACEDRYRHAIANSAGMRYTIPNFVTDLQYGANVMLAHWQYYKKDIDPLNLDIRAREKSQLNFLDAEQLMFIVQSHREAAKMQSDFDYIRETDFWEHPYFYVSQMFEIGWSPRRIWTVNYPGPDPRRLQ